MAKLNTKLVNLSASQVFNLITKGTVTNARAGVLTIDMKKGKKTVTYLVPVNGVVADEVVPAEEAAAGAAPAKRRGRPKKTDAAPKKRGRPKKTEDAPKKKRGRPKKTEEAPKKKRGRPKKAATKKAAPKKRGRPPKKASDSAPKKRGRPKGSGKKAKKTTKKKKKNLLDLKL